MKILAIQIMMHSFKIPDKYPQESICGFFLDVLSVCMCVTVRQYECVCVCEEVHTQLT